LENTVSKVEEDLEAASPSVPEESQPSPADTATPASTTELPTSAPTRKRGKRKVTKKVTSKDDEGFLGMIGIHS